MPEKTLQSIEDLKPADYNPRKIGKDALESLGYSLEEFGDIAGLTYNKRTGNMVCGHQRMTALKQMHNGGLKLENGAVVTPTGERFKVRVVDWDLRKEKAANLVANNPLIGGEFLPEAAILIDEIDLEMGDLAEKLKLTDLKDILPDFELPPDPEEDQIPEVPPKPYSRTGDLWRLGDHRLLCGDSTKRQDVEVLMDGEKAALFATDPPYLVDYTGADRPNDSGKDWSDSYHEIEIKDARNFFHSIFLVAKEFLKPNAAWYCWHAHKRAAEIESVWEELGVINHQQIIWVKPTALHGYGYWPYRHEPCLMGWLKGNKPPHDGDNSHTYTTVWEVDWEGKGRVIGNEHPTQKPIELFARPMRKHTRQGNICYEPFSGSGSQIIAAEMLRRKCYSMEIEPRFVDVSVLRWQQRTSQIPVLEREGKREEVDLKAEIEAISNEGQESQDPSIATTKNESATKTSKKNKRQGKKGSGKKSEDEGSGSEDDGDDEGRKWPYIAKPVRFTKEQRMVIDQAIAQVRKELGDPSMTEGRCCELMAADCLAGNPSNREQIS